MSGVIKGYNGAGFVVNGRVKIDNRISSEILRDRVEQKSPQASRPQQTAQPQQEQPSASEQERAAAIEQAELAIRRQEEAKKKELEQMKENMLAQAREQARAVLQKAEEEAAWIMDKANNELNQAKEQAEGIIAQAESEVKRATDEATEKGYDEGFEKGTIDGFDQGYLNGLKKCKDTLVELKRINSDLLSKKSEMFKSYERQIFDTVLEIAQKITVNSLKQKDKAVIQKMIKEAAKEFRTAQNVKITLSSLDFSDETQVDYEKIKSLFLDEATVEIEILDDAEAGTLMIDNGSEILDAGVSTQLRMIEELGKGKYRDKPSEYDNSISEKISSEAVEEAEVVPEAVEEAEAAPEAVEEAEATPEAVEEAEATPEAVEEAEVAPEAVEEAEAIPEAVEEAQSEALPELTLTPSDAMPELVLIDDSGAAVSADELQKKSEEQATLEAQAKKAELEKFEELEKEHAKEMEKEAKRTSRSSRPRKPTNPLLGKMLDNLGE